MTFLQLRENQANRVRKAETNIKCWIAASRGPGFWSYLVLWEVSDQKQSQVTLVFLLHHLPPDGSFSISSWQNGDYNFWPILLSFFFFFFGYLGKWSSRFICFLTLIGISFFLSFFVICSQEMNPDSHAPGFFLLILIIERSHWAFPVYQAVC